MRTSEAMELSVLKRKWGLIWRCRASRRASSSRRFCSSSFISMRSAFHTLSAMPTTMGAHSQTSACSQGLLASSAKSRDAEGVGDPVAADLHDAAMRKSMRNWRSMRGWRRLRRTQR
jgi:hypothetical protein